MAPRFKAQGLALFMHRCCKCSPGLAADSCSLGQPCRQWRESAHLADFKQRAVEYAAHAETALEKILQQREDKIKVYTELPVEPPQVPSYYWKDELAGQRGVGVRSRDGNSDKHRRAVREHAAEH